MKRKLFYLISLLATSSMIVACGGNDIIGGGSDGGDNGSSNNGGGNVITLPNTMEEAANKFYQLGQRQGFEVTFLTIDDETNVRENQQRIRKTVII